MKHPLAFIHPEAQIAENVTIDPFATIEKDVVIGEGTHIYSHAVIMDGARIGKNCRIFPGAVIAGIPQDLKFHGEKSVAIIGDNCIIANATQIAGEVEIEDYAVVGGASAVHQFTRIGRHTMIQGGSLVGKDVPPYVTAGRLPVSYAGLNSIGLRRRGFTNETINAIQDIYRIIYQSGLNVSDAIAKVEAEIPQSAERDEIIEFVKKSSRGIIKGYNG